MISDERRYGDRIQAHMRWLSCTARECGPAAQRDMDRWVCAHVEHGAVPPVPPALEALGVKKSLSRNELRKRLRTEGAGRGRTEQAASGKLQNFLKDAALAARCQRWEFRVAEEMRANAGWYVVWASLTFDPKAWDPEYELRENRAFDRFAMRMAESVRMALGLRQPQDGGPQRSDYCRHVGVVEHGVSRLHHHIHALFWCRDVPTEWKVDPNVGRLVPNASQILGAKALWTYDIASKVEPFRFLGDRWSREGWMLPVKEGRPMVLTPAECAGSYLVKYLSKEAKEWNHRVMATRGLGMSRVSRFLSSLSPRRLLGLNQHYPVWMRPHLRPQNVPLGLLRSAARAVFWSKMSRQSQGLALLWRWTNRATSIVYSRMRSAVTSGDQPWSMDSEERQSWLLALLPPLDPSVCCSEVVKLFDRLAELWPAERATRVEALPGVAS